MNTNKNAKRILCFGDSNTWGVIPASRRRYDTETRWTGLLQKKLGTEYEIIEEGLNSRTTVIDDPKRPGKCKNGKTYLTPCLHTHDPIDLVILFLGTNDLKEYFERSAEQIARGVEELIHIIQNTKFRYVVQPPKILLICPTIVDESVDKTKEKYFGAEKKSRQLGKLYQEIANKYKIPYIDLSKEVQPSKKDGYHFEPETHKKVADLIAEAIKNILN